MPFPTPESRCSNGLRAPDEVGDHVFLYCSPDPPWRPIPVRNKVGVSASPYPMIVFQRNSQLIKTMQTLNAPSAISRRAAIGRLGVLGGAFLAWHYAGDLFAQTAPPEDVIAQMRKTMGAIPPVSSKLTDQVHMISGPGGNIAVYTWADGKLAVDSGTAGSSDNIFAQMDTYGPQPLRILVNTHWHFDHTDGNEPFHKKGALIIAHENVRKRMAAAQDIDFFHAHIPASPAAALPESTFPNGTTLNLGGEEIRVTHLDPAHTDGDSVIQFVNANVVHAGDLVFSASYPFIDYSTGGRIAGMVAASNRILALTNSSTQIIPGHGPVIKAEELKQYRDMLADIDNAVRTMKKQGKEIDAIVAARPTQKYNEKWGKGMLAGDAFTRVTFASL